MQVIVDFQDYKPWAGAVSAYEKIVEEGKLEGFESFLDEYFIECEAVSETTINDLLWFEEDFIFDNLGIGYED